MKSASEANELVLGLVCFGVMLIPSEAGFQFGRRSGNYAAKETNHQLLAGEVETSHRRGCGIHAIKGSKSVAGSLQCDKRRYGRAAVSVL